MSVSLPKQIAILGPGLLGGSLLMALREKIPGVHLRAWARRAEAVDAIAARNLADVTSTDLKTVLDGADFVVICTPVETMADLANKMTQTSMQEGCVITDVGSVKGTVVSALDEAFLQTSFHFVGCHPMAGSERAGLEAARSDLFQQQACILTPTTFTDPTALEITRTFWRLLGCRLLEMSPPDHDRTVARISHLPRLGAAVIAQAALQDDQNVVSSIGNGFRDTTRVAAGDADLWTGIVMENRSEVLAAVRDARDRFSELVAILENVDEVSLRRFLSEAKTLRDTVPPCLR